MARLTTYTHAGLVFDVRDEGPVDGEVVVLLHGFPERASSWDRVVPLLHAQGYRTLAPDLRGYSRGARPTGSRSAYAAETIAGDVHALVEHLAQDPGDGTSAVERVHLVGHDWGAVIAWTYAGLHPERLHSLTAVSVPHPHAFLRAGLRSTQLLKSWYMGFFQLPRVPEWVAHQRPALFARVLAHAGMRGEDLARFQAEIVEDGALPGGLGYYRALPASLRGGGMKRRVRVPTTMVWSDGDTAVDGAGARLSGDYVDADYELVVLEGVSHWVPEHAPEALAEVILERAASSTSGSTGGPSDPGAA